MEPGFLHLGWRESLAILMAVAIVVDWATDRYLRPRAPMPPRRAG